MLNTKTDSRTVAGLARQIVAAIDAGARAGDLPAGMAGIAGLYEALGIDGANAWLARAGLAMSGTENGHRAGCPCTYHLVCAEAERRLCARGGQHGRDLAAGHGRGLADAAAGRTPDISRRSPAFRSGYRLASL